MSPGTLFLPLGAGFGYACAAIVLKRALGAGASLTSVSFLSNGVMALLFQLLWFFPGKMIDPEMLLAPAFCGLFFFLGQIFTFRAIATGDVSVATPLLGSKVLLVALFSLFLLGNSLSASWWVAALLASVGIALISATPGGSHRHSGVTAGWALGAAAIFALTDVLVQKWVPDVGYGRFAPIMFGVNGLIALVYLPPLLRPIWDKRSEKSVLRKMPVSSSRTAFAWLLIGSLLLALQSLAMYSSIGLYGNATLTNILYGSRCLWSVLLVWSLGSVAGDFSSPKSQSLIMGRRLIGSAFLFGAMALVLR